MNKQTNRAKKGRVSPLKTPEMKTDAARLPVLSGPVLGTVDGPSLLPPLLLDLLISHMSTKDAACGSIEISLLLWQECKNLSLSAVSGPQPS